MIYRVGESTIYCPLYKLFCVTCDTKKFMYTMEQFPGFGIFNIIKRKLKLLRKHRNLIGSIFYDL